MTRLNKFIILIWFCFVTSAQSHSLTILDSVLQNGFPNEPNRLLQTTDELWHEYESQKNIASLIFFSYGALKLANYFNEINDYVKASELSKTGFFYLDESADLYEDNYRIRYLRARVDAYLPAKLGRCVITLSDTAYLLDHAEYFNYTLMSHIYYMRYRALYSCGELLSANSLLLDMQQRGEGQSKLLAYGTDKTPEWDETELTQVVIPLMKGE